MLYYSLHTQAKEAPWITFIHGAGEFNHLV